MSKKKQIEEMAEVYYKARLKARETLGSMNEGEEMWYSKAFFEAGYRKQSEGEWKDGKCSVCGSKVPIKDDGKGFMWHISDYKANYCPNCGAKMKGV